MFSKTFIIMLGLAAVVSARPQLLTFKDGQVGVNFLGYHASAGLGGLLTGDAASGGLHAEAGTPWGARAGAGLGGNVGGEGQGRTSGGLYAGATSGFGKAASASLGGSTSAEGSYGTSVVATKGITKTVEIESPPPVVAHTVDKNVEVVSEVEHVAPVKQVTVQQVQAPVQAHAGFTFTKTVQPVAYTKTITKTVQAAPVQTETRYKTVETAAPVEATKTEFVEEVHDAQVPQYYNTVYLRKRLRPRHFYKHHGFYPAQAAYFGGAFEAGAAPVPVGQVTIHKNFAVQPVQTEVQTQVVKEVQPTVQVVKQVHTVPVVQTQVVKKIQPVQVVKEVHTVQQPVQGGGAFQAQGNFRVGGGTRTFFDDIFNIPIATLGAVNQFLNNKAGGAQGSFQVSKQVNYG